jgi:hypothetical protein
MAAVYTPVSLLDLVFLYRGEISTDGYELTQGTSSETLLREICRVAEPPTVPRLFGLLYPGWQLAQIPAAERLVVQRAFNAWKEGR